MKNENQENGVLRGPLILFVPASNLVAILSLDWLDGTERAAVSAKTHGWNYMANSTENSERSGRAFGELSRPAFATTPIMFESSLSMHPNGSIMIR
jgi:hypothetical protein